MTAMNTPTRLAEIAERHSLVRSMPEFVTQLTVEYGQAASLWLDKYLSEDGGPARWLDMGAGQRSGMLWQAQIDYLIGILAAERAQLTTAQARSREDAEIMREAANQIHNDNVCLNKRGKGLNCLICEAKTLRTPEPFNHTPDCLVTKLRARADELEGRT